MHTSTFFRLVLNELELKGPTLCVGGADVTLPQESSSLATTTTEQTFANKTIVGDGLTQHISANALTCGDYSVDVSTKTNRPLPGQTLTIEEDTDKLKAAWSYPPPFSDIFKATAPIPSSTAAKIHVFTLPSHTQLCFCSATLLFDCAESSSVCAIRGAFRAENHALVRIGQPVVENYSSVPESNVTLVADGLELYIYLDGRTTDSICTISATLVSSEN